MKAIILKPGNIYSGDRYRAVFTNPTELAFRKGNLKNHWPIMFGGTVYPDAEAAYQHNSRTLKHNYRACRDLVIEILIVKLNQYPVLYQTIVKSGGSKWIEACDHVVNARTANFKRWEGTGVQSDFIRCLMIAFKSIERKS